VWKVAWPTVLTNAIGGLQGLVDHVLVGHLVGFAGNAAIGVAWQIFLVVIAFISSLFTGMGVLVARFAGANEPETVDRAVYQAFLTAVGPVGARDGAARLRALAAVAAARARRRRRCARRRCRSCA
jgi:Na+-driven multidrug efflux pump